MTLDEREYLLDCLARWFLRHPDQERARAIWLRMAGKNGEAWRAQMSERILRQRAAGVRPEPRVRPGSGNSRP